MRLWQANLGRGVSPAVFERNLRNILDAAGPRAVIAFQEIDEADAPDEHAILTRLTRDTHQMVGAATAVPILVPRYLHLVADSQRLACKGLAKYTPNRVVNTAEIRLGPNLTVAVLNTHVPINRPATWTRRAQVRKALQREADNHVAGVWVADTNSGRGWPIIADGEVTVTDAGIDKAKAWGPVDRRVVVTDRVTVPLSIDGHDAHGARIRWERR